jgi:hypothetical protein
MSSLRIKHKREQKTAPMQSFDRATKSYLCNKTYKTSLNSDRWMHRSRPTEAISLHDPFSHTRSAAPRHLFTVPMLGRLASSSVRGIMQIPCPTSQPCAAARPCSAGCTGIAVWKRLEREDPFLILSTRPVDEAAQRLGNLDQRVHKRYLPKVISTN